MHVAAVAANAVRRVAAVVALAAVAQFTSVQILYLNCCFVVVVVG